MSSQRKVATLVLLAILLVSAAGAGEQRYSATGLVLKLDAPRKTVVVSCQAIPGYMDAMVMPVSVRDAKNLEGVAPGATIEFTLVVGKESAYAEQIKVRRFESMAQEPLQARRLKILDKVLGAAVVPLAAGDVVPDFSLTDQERHTINLHRFAGRVVAINFVYTRCVYPEYCFRLSNNFGQLQKRFAQQMGRDLVLLTVSFDPLHDTPEVLADYAKTWKADTANWHFLTGDPTEVQRVCRLFDVDAWQDEALLTHTMHTAIIDRRGKMAANLEGNQYTAEQLGDLVETVIQRTP